MEGMGIVLIALAAIALMIYGIGSSTTGKDRIIRLTEECIAEQIKSDFECKHMAHMIVNGG